MKLTIVLFCLLFATRAQCLTSVGSHLVGAGGGEISSGRISGIYSIGETIVGPNRESGAQLHAGFIASVSTRLNQSIPRTERGVVNAFWLSPAYPNPFNPTTHIRYSVPSPTEVVVRVLDASGRTILERSPEIAKGTMPLSIDGSGWNSGVYFVSVKSRFGGQVRPIVLEK